MCKAAMPHLKKTEGCIVNVTSIAGLRPMGSSLAYGMAKAALNALTEDLAKFHGPVRCNAVAPGLVATPWTSEWGDLHTSIAAISPTVDLPVATTGEPWTVTTNTATTGDVVTLVITASEFIYTPTVVFWSGTGTAGTWTGSSFTAHDFSGTGGNENLVVAVDGVEVTVSLTINCDSVSSCAGSFPAIAGAEVSHDGTNLVITSSLTGTPSSTAAVVEAGSGPNALALFGSSSNSYGTGVAGTAGAATIHRQLFFASLSA